MAVFVYGAARHGAHFLTARRGVAVRNARTPPLPRAFLPLLFVQACQTAACVPGSFSGDEAYALTSKWNLLDKIWAGADLGHESGWRSRLELFAITRQLRHAVAEKAVFWNTRTRLPGLLLLLAQLSHQLNPVVAHVVSLASNSARSSSVTGAPITAGSAAASSELAYPPGPLLNVWPFLVFV